MKTQLKESMRHVIALLVSGKYSDLEKLTSGSRLGASDVANAISKYGKHLVMPPESAWELLGLIEVLNANEAKWSATMPLWSREEGRSDLSLELTLVPNANGIKIELDDIHVL